jgi:hypothetical protein
MNDDDRRYKLSPKGEEMMYRLTPKGRLLIKRLRETNCTFDEALADIEATLASDPLVHDCGTDLVSGSCPRCK